MKTRTTVYGKKGFSWSTRSDGLMLVKAIKETNLNSFNNFNVFQSPKMPLDTVETSKNNVTCD